jgi:uncharacterized protein YndB with AHSA1/START domain
MDRSAHEPTDLADIDCVASDGGWTLVMPWDLPGPPDAVWRLLTDAALLARWSPFTPLQNLDRLCPDSSRDVGAKVERDGHGHDLELHVVRTEPGVRLEYAFPDDRVVWTLTPIDGGTRVTLRHTFAAWDWAGDVAAGWHLGLTTAAGLLDGAPAPACLSPAATNRRWRDLSCSYLQMLVFAGWLELDPNPEPARLR